MKLMKLIVFFLLILVFVLINLKFNIEKFQSSSEITMAKTLLKSSIFNENKCLSKKELKKKLNSQIDKYLNLYFTFSGKDKLCLGDIEKYMN